MASTLEHAVTQDEWTLVAEEAKNVAIQLGEQGQVRVHIGETEPGSGAAGILIAVGTPDVPSEFSAAGLPDGAKVWARANNDDEVTIIVMQF